MEKRIYYHDTDAGGVVYYANYLNYLEEARTEFLENKGLSVASFAERGYLYAVKKCNVHYRYPARYGDTIECTAQLRKITAAQLMFNQTILHKETQQIMVEADVTLVCLTPDFKPAVIPDDIKTLLI